MTKGSTGRRGGDGRGTRGNFDVAKPIAYTKDEKEYRKKQGLHTADSDDDDDDDDEEEDDTRENEELTELELWTALRGENS